MSGGNARESLNNSIKLLRQSMSMMGQKIERVKDAGKIQDYEVRNIINCTEANSIHALPIQSCVIQNDNLEMQIRILRRELENKQEDRNFLIHTNQELDRQKEMLENKRIVKAEQSKDLSEEREKNSASFEKIHTEITQMMDKITQTQDMYAKQVQKNDQDRYIMYQEICQAESLNEMLRQENANLQGRHERLKNIDVAQTAKVIQDAASTIVMLQQKLQQLEQQEKQQHLNNYNLEQSMQANYAVQNISKNSIAASRPGMRESLERTNKLVVQSIVEHSRLNGAQTASQSQSVFNPLLATAGK